MNYPTEEFHVIKTVKIKNNGKRHLCVWGDLEKTTTEELAKIMDLKVLFFKCKCGKVMPFKTTDFIEECTNGKMKLIQRILKKRNYHLYLPQY